MAKGSKDTDAVEASIDQLVQGIKRHELLSKHKLYERVRQLQKVSKKDFDAWWDKRGHTVHELYAKPQKRFKFARITGPPYSFQIDTIHLNRYKRQNGGKSMFLLLVEIGSRKAFAYVLKSEKTADVLTVYKRFLKDAGHLPFFVKGDNYFAAEAFVEQNAERNIVVLTNVAADEHVTRGNPLGILDRLVRTLRTMIQKRIHVTGNAKWTEWLPEVLEDYNSNPHKALKGRSPDQEYDDLLSLHRRWVENSAYNKSLSKEVEQTFRPGDYVRMKLEKGAFEKGATQTMSLEVYQVASVKGGRVELKTYPAGEKVARAAKPNELIRVNRPIGTAPAPPTVMETAKKEARQARRLAKEGLPEPPLPRVSPAGDTLADAAETGKLLVVDAEGQGQPGEDPHVLTVVGGANNKGYVYAGVVTKISKSRVYVKLYVGTGTGDNPLEQKRLKADGKSHPLDAKAHKDAVLYVGDPPRVRSDGTTSLPKRVVDAVKKEYVYS